MLSHIFVHCLVIGFEGSGMDDGTLRNKGKIWGNGRKNKNYKPHKRLQGWISRASLKGLHMAKQIRDIVYQITNFPKGMSHSGRGLVITPEYAFYFNQDWTMKNPWGLMEGLGKRFLSQHIRNLQERILAPGVAVLRLFLWVEAWGEKKERMVLFRSAGSPSPYSDTHHLLLIQPCFSWYR